MKKVFLLATAALLVTGITFAEGGKKGKKDSKKSCCSKGGKSCKKDNSAKEKETTVKL